MVVVVAATSASAAAAAAKQPNDNDVYHNHDIIFSTQTFYMLKYSLKCAPKL